MSDEIRQLVLRELSDASNRECEALRANVDGGELMHVLRAKLAAAEADVARLVSERERLMEISNMLRADLNRVLAEGSPAQVVGTLDSQQVQREVAARYETKLGEIEAAMQELIGQNRALKAELRRWTAEGLDALPQLPSTSSGGGAACLAGSGDGAPASRSSLERRAGRAAAEAGRDETLAAEAADTLMDREPNGEHAAPRGFAGRPPAKDPHAT